MKKNALWLALFSAGMLTVTAHAQQQQQSQGSDMQFTQEQTVGKGAPLYLSPATVRQIQQKLNQSGFDAGDIDGSWGQKSQQALRTFQQAKNLEPTGQLNMRTLHALGLGDVLQAEMAAMETREGGAQGGQSQTGGAQGGQSQIGGGQTGRSSAIGGAESGRSAAGGQSGEEEETAQ